MTTNNLQKVETIVNALLQVSDSVVEVSREHVFTKIWNAPGVTTGNLNSYLGKKISEIGNDSIFAKAATRVDQVFASGKNEQIAYKTIIRDVPVAYSIGIIAIHPDPNFIFIVFKNLSDHSIEIVEDKWKLALDAAGDGVWDANLKSGKMFFSEKWHEIFGYSPSEVTDSGDWASKIHPDDLGIAKARSEAYLTGATPSYSSEVRYLCKDGSYKWILSRGVVIARDVDGSPVRFIGTHTDIHDRKLAEERYQANAQLWAVLLASLKDGILVTDEHARIIFANQAFCDIYNMDITPDAILGIYARDGLQTRKTYFKKQEEYLAKTLYMLDSDHMVLDEEWELKDGSTLIRDYIPVFLKSGVRIGIWKLRDITEHKNTEKRFEQQRNFYEQVLNSIASHIVVWDDQRRYLFVNPVAVKDPAVREWLVGKTDEEYCRYRNRPLSIAKKRNDYFDTVIASGETVQWVERLEAPNGEVEHHLRTLTPVYDENGALYVMIGYGIDITDRVKAQEALKTSQETFASAFDYSGVGMALISPYGKWLDVNKVICEITGYTKEELLHQTYQEITYEEDRELDRELINKMLRHQISTYTIEKRYVSKQQKIILISLTVSLVWNSDDSPKFFIAQVVDITQKKELENEISRKNAELESARLSLINKVSQLEQLSHIIAHNLRGPAGNIHMLTDALTAKLKGGEAAAANPLSAAFTVDQTLGYIHESSTSLMSSLQTLMELAEIKLNKDVPYDNCDIARMIQDIIGQLHGVIYEKKAMINLDLGVTFISYPRAYMESILYNFISNALKYSNTDVPPEITVTTRIMDGRTQIIVKDNGIGIDIEKYGDRLFKLNEVFHQGYDSKGVGLYITKTQVESFGGSIEVRSAPNKGSEFIVTL